MERDGSSKYGSGAMLIVGVALIVAGGLIFIPVAVNLPDSWAGAVLAGALIAVGCVVANRASRNLRVSEPK